MAIGIGFGMQALFKNLISGVLVLVERPFRLGDVIEVGALRGMVVDIDLRTSVVRDADGADTLIPNSVLMEENVKNVHVSDAACSARRSSVVVDGDSDPRAVVDAMRAAAQRHGQLADDPEPAVLLEDFAGQRAAIRAALLGRTRARHGPSARRERPAHDAAGRVRRRRRQDGTAAARCVARKIDDGRMIAAGLRGGRAGAARQTHAPETAPGVAARAPVRAPR